MKTDELQNYLQDVVNLEIKKYMLNKIYYQMNMKIQSLGHPSYLPEPVKKTKNLAKPTKPTPTKGLTALAIFGGIMASLFSFGMVLYFSNSIIITIAWCILLSVVFPIVINKNIAQNNKNNMKRYNDLLIEYQKQCENLDDGSINYKRDMEIYQQKLINDEERIIKENELKNNMLIQLEGIKDSFENTINTLNTIYELNILHKKYQTVIAVTSFLEYFETGRCETLREAMNIYENELRLDKISLQLERVIDNLNDFKETQYYLYNELIEANKKLSNFYSELEEIKSYSSEMLSNSKMIAYNSKVTADNTKLIEQYKYFEHIDHIRR